MQPGQEIRIESLSRLDLHRHQRFTLLNQHIDLFAGVVSPEVQIGGQTLVEAIFLQLTDDEIFEQCAPGGVDRQMRCIADPHQVSGKSGVVEIQLWGLDQPLAKVLMMRLEHEDDIAGFQD